MNPDQLVADFKIATAALKTYRGALRRLRPITLDRDAASHMTTLKENEAIRRLPRQELNRIQLDVRGEEEATRRAATGIARQRASGPVRDIVATSRATVAAARRDVLLSPSKVDTFDHVTADGMISAALLEMQLERWLGTKGLGELLPIYTADIERSDVRSALEMKIIEAMHARGELLAADDEARKARRALALMIAEEQALRVPADLPDFDALEQQLSALDARADVLHVSPLDPAQDLAASAAFEETLEAMNAAGEATDADDQAALRETFAS